MFILESIYFSVIMVLFSIIINYVYAFILAPKIIWFPDHFFDMIMGTFISSFMVYIILARKYIDYKCKRLNPK